MQKISLIAILDKNSGLGKNNQLLCHLPADLKRFKSLTLHKPVIMGRKTFQSIGKPLPDRQNIVLSSQQTLEGVQVAHSLTAALDLVVDYPEIMIIGGASLYKQALPLATDLYLTVIENQFEADVFFPQVDLSNWRCLSRIEKQQDDKNKYNMTFYHYQLRVE